MTDNAVSENPLGLGLVIVGAAALAISVFLPFVQPVSALRMVEDNTLIQNGGWGWVLIGAALGIAVNGYRASRGRLTGQWLLLICCIVAAGIIFVDANNNDLRTLYPVGPNGTVDTSQPGTHANLGIAVYVAGAGVLAAFMAWLLFLQGEDENGARVAPAPKRNAGVRKPASPPKSQAKRQRAQAELEAEAKTAEAEAEAAEAEVRAAKARVRAIRLRLDAEAKAEPAPTPQISEPAAGPRSDPQQQTD